MVETYPRWDDNFNAMTAEQALFAKKLRDDGHSWRSVAGNCNTAWHGDWDTNQLAGMDILIRAEEVLGAEPNSILQSA